MYFGGPKVVLVIALNGNGGARVGRAEIVIRDVMLGHAATRGVMTADRETDADATNSNNCYHQVKPKHDTADRNSGYCPVLLGMNLAAL